MGSFSRKMLGFFISLDSNPFLFFLNTFTLPPIIKESDGLWMMHPEVPDWWGCLCVVPCATSRTSQKYVYIYLSIYLFIYFHSVYIYIDILCSAYPGCRYLFIFVFVRSLGRRCGFFCAGTALQRLLCRVWRSHWM